MSNEQLPTREAFFDRIRKALGPRPAETPAPPAVDDALVRLASTDDDVVGLFATNLEALGGSVRRCAADQLNDTLTALLAELQAKRVLLSVDRLPQAKAIGEALRSAGIELAPWRDDPAMAHGYDADAGITDVHAALAETGTLICTSDADHGRGASLVPPIHIAIVRASDVLPDLLDYLPRWRGVAPVELPSAQALITGPSKTADIEGILITGVHGPGQVIAIVVEDA